MKRWLLLCLLIQCCLLPLVWPLYVVGDYNDDASYLALARSLAQGLPYQDLFELNFPARVRFPPGYPIVLAPLQGLFPHQFWLARVEAVIFSLAALALFVRTSFRLELKAAALLLAVNPFWAFSGSTMMSEGLFTLAVLLYLDRLEKSVGVRQSFILGLAASLCYFVRVVGLVLVPTTLLWRRKQPTSLHFFFLLGFALGAGPHALGNLVTGYDGELARTQAGLLQVWQENLIAIPVHYGAVMVGYPLLQLKPLFCVVFGLALVGLAPWARRSPAACWTFCYLLAMLTWPYCLPRFALPALPFLYLGLVSSLRRPPLVGLVLFLEVYSALAPRPPNRLSPEPQIKAMLSRVPPGRPIATAGMDLGIYADLPTYGQSALDLVQREWAWEEGLLDNNIGVVALVGDDLALKPRFEQRPSRYTRVFDSPELIAFTFHPTPAHRRATLLHTAARAALERRRFPTAERLFRRALQLAPEHATLHSGLAFCLAQQERLPDAIEEARQAVRLDSQNQEAKNLVNFFGE